MERSYDHHHIVGIYFHKRKEGWRLYFSCNFFWFFFRQAKHHRIITSCSLFQSNCFVFIFLIILFSLNTSNLAVWCDSSFSISSKILASSISFGCLTWPLLSWLNSLNWNKLCAELESRHWPDSVMCCCFVGYTFSIKKIELKEIRKTFGKWQTNKRTSLFA